MSLASGGILLSLALTTLASDTDPTLPPEPTPPPAPATPAPPAPPAPFQPMPLPQLAEGAGWILEPAPEEEARTPEDRAQQRLDRAMGDAVERDRLETLGADPWYWDAARAMRREFRPNMREVERERRAPMSTVQQVVDELSRYAEPPSSSQQPRVPPPEMTLGRAGHEDLMEAQTQAAHDLRNAPATWYRVDLRVTHGPEGELMAAWVLRTSGFRALDEAALRAVRSRTVILSPPPPAVVGTRQAIQSDWAFEAADVASYWNDAGCVDDPGGVQCAIFGRGIVRTRIRLLRVLDATHSARGPTLARRRD